MTLIEQLADEQTWNEFFSYKQQLGHLSQQHEKELQQFIGEKAYLEVLDRIRTKGFPLPQKRLISKVNSDKKRVVYTYPTANLAVPFNNGAGVTWEWATDSWTENSPNAKLPLLTTYTDAPENFIPSTKWLRNASYLRMKNIQLTYDFPKQLLRPLRIEGLQVYISGQNLWTLSDFDLWDPEITTTRTNLYEYPNLKTISVGLNLSF